MQWKCSLCHQWVDSCYTEHHHASHREEFDPASRKWVKVLGVSPETTVTKRTTTDEIRSYAYLERTMTDPKYMRAGLDFARGKAIEELGELLAALGKSIRWGWHSANPELAPHLQETNEQWVRREMADVRGALDNLVREMDDGLTATGHIAAKRTAR